MAVTWLPHVVRPGEYTTALAFSRGETTDAVWNHAKNADLKKLRKSPDILQPGDILFLPSEPPPGVDLTAENENEYAVAVPIVSVHVCLRDADGKPYAGEEVEIFGGESDEPTTDGDGNLHLKVGTQTPSVRVLLKKSGHTFHIRVGHLDPHDSQSGAHSRLRQLGYVGPEEAILFRRGDPRATSEEARDLRRSRALAHFQKDSGLAITGQLDDATAAELLGKYGT